MRASGPAMPGGRRMAEGEAGEAYVVGHTCLLHGPFYSGRQSTLSMRSIDAGSPFSRVNPRAHLGVAGRC